MLEISVHCAARGQRLKRTLKQRWRIGEFHHLVELAGHNVIGSWRRPIRADEMNTIGHRPAVTSGQRSDAVAC
jgi:hypothetical protein